MIKPVDILGKNCTAGGSYPYDAGLPVIDADAASVIFLMDGLPMLFKIKRELCASFRRIGWIMMLKERFFNWPSKRERISSQSPRLFAFNLLCLPLRKPERSFEGGHIEDWAVLIFHPPALGLGTKPFSILKRVASSLPHQPPSRP